MLDLVPKDGSCASYRSREVKLVIGPWDGTDVYDGRKLQCNLIIIITRLKVVFNLRKTNCLGKYVVSVQMSTHWSIFKS